MMKLFLFMLLCAILLTACGVSPQATEPVSAPTATAEIPTTNPTTVPEEDTTVPTTVPTEEPVIPTTPPTQPPHSALYVPGLDVEDVLTWFNEVCLVAEFVHSGDPSFLQKWDCPILYQIHGEPTPEDLAILESFAQWLNTLEGFPGIQETSDPLETNLNIHFCPQSEMLSLMGDWTHDLDGAVTFWYDNNRIYDATICVRTDLDQHLRNSVILEELYNGLGPIQDTTLRPDSIIYAEFSEPQTLTEIDKLILQLLYHPDTKCGMDAGQCEEVIKSLYY